MVTLVLIIVVSASIAAALCYPGRRASLSAGGLPATAPLRLGGAAVVFAFMAPLAVLVASKNLTGDMRGVALLVGGALIALLGFFDDIEAFRARTKITVQIAVAAGLWFVGFRLESLGIFGVGIPDLLTWLDLVLTVFWIVLMINAVGLIDRVGSLAAFVALFAASVNLVLAMQAGNQPGALCACMIAGAVAGFLFFNWSYPVVFMGSMGSMFLGYVLAAVSMTTGQITSTVFGLAVPIVALGIPVTDRLVSMFPVFLGKRAGFSAGDDQWREAQVVYIVLFALGASAIVMTALADAWAALTMWFCAVALFCAVRLLGLFRSCTLEPKAVGRNQLVEKLRPVLGQFSSDAIENARFIDDVWDALCELCRGCGFKKVSWRTQGVSPPDSRRAVLPARGSWEYGRSSPNGFVTFTSVAPIGNGSCLTVEYVIPESLGKLDREAEELMGAVAGTLAAAMKSLGRRQVGNYRAGV